jgi:transcriptional regulator with XRE-family HTH domain
VAGRVGASKGEWAPFGALLRRYRRAAGLTQQTLAERAGYSVVYVSMLERGERRPQEATVEAIASALGLSGFDHAALHAVARGEKGPTLIGRTAELDLLNRHLAGDGPPVLLFAGEPGIGKTRLLKETRRLALTGGWKVLEGGCSRRGGQDPYSPLLEAVQRYVQEQETERLREELDGCAWLTRLLPELAEILGRPASLEASQERRLMLDALSGFLRQAAGPAGTLLILDDLQWAGSDALESLLAILRQDGSLRLVAAYRDVEVLDRSPLALWLGDLAQSARVTHRALGRLDDAEAEALLDTLLADRPPLSAEQREWVLRNASGVPFFVTSFAHELRSSELSGQLPSGVPWDITQGVLNRVASLPPQARDVLEVAAVAGRSISSRVLSEVTGLDPHALSDSLAHISRARILIEDGDRAYRFQHDVIREVLESNVGAARRREIHRRVATALEQTGAIEELAYHYAHSDQDELAATYLELAGDRAGERYAHAAAEGYYRELVDRLDVMGDQHRAAAAREKLGGALTRAGQFDTALAVLEAAARLWRALGERDREWSVVARIGHVHERRGTPDEGIERLERLRVMPGARPPRIEAEMDAALAALFLLTGRYAEQLAVAEDASRLATECGDLRLRAVAEVWRGCALNQLGRLDEGRLAQEGAIPLAEAAGDLGSLSHALNDIGFLTEIAGEFEISRRYKERALDIAESGGDPLSIATMVFRCGQNAFLRGDWQEAERLFNRGAHLAGSLGASSIAAYPPFGLSLLAFGRGDIPAARALAGQALATASGVDVQAEHGALGLLAECDLREGKPEEARARLESVPHDGEGLGLYPIQPVLAEALFAVGQVDGAHEAAERAIRAAETRRHRVAMVDALRVRALTGNCLDDLHAALSLARSIQYPFGELRVLEMWARIGGGDNPRSALLRRQLVREPVAV